MAGNCHSSAALASAILQHRRSRSLSLPSEFFAEPAWDLLLELYLADAHGKSLTALEVCDRSQIPPQVMVRWLRHLCQIGYVIGDTNGDVTGRVTISAAALSKMEQVLDRPWPPV